MWIVGQVATHYHLIYTTRVSRSRVWTPGHTIRNGVFGLRVDVTEKLGQGRERFSAMTWFPGHVDLQPDHDLQSTWKLKSFTG